ncbi:MAG: DUF86 domain-containing protein [Candidatus Tectomicrobia bacterium]|uniref:DUF86 domain-containing protein n=1 Tax=Tectimicrobiota bacterium TaxID=2528274 RepID=A0A932GP26_UNCTE|nr:DUF86 domain-containing protein [Candidatus Tectomicrobia bacterium]
MSSHEDLIRMRHMLDHAREAVSLIQGKTRPDLDTSRLLQLALVRLIEIVGEAASRISKKAQVQHPQIPWAQIVGMRNRLIHGYDFVDFDILWQTVTKELPEIITELERVVPPKEA